MSVLLPAPFSPTRACTSPGCRSKATSSTATTPPNRLVTPSSLKTGDTSVAATPPARVSSGSLKWPLLPIQPWRGPDKTSQLLVSFLPSVLCTLRLIFLHLHRAAHGLSYLPQRSQVTSGVSLDHEVP